MEGQLSEQVLRQAALDALQGVGDKELGEWAEFGGYAYHVRRRLSAIEQVEIGPARDIRGSMEAKERIARIQKFLPKELRGKEV